MTHSSTVNLQITINHLFVVVMEFRADPKTFVNTATNAIYEIGWQSFYYDFSCPPFNAENHQISS